MDLADALHGKLPDARRVLRTSTQSGAQVSPDGERLLLSRRLATAAGQSEIRLAVMPFGGGAETPVPATGSLRRAKWADSVTVSYLAQTNAGLHLALVDVRTGAERQPLDLSDSLIGAYDPLPGGWAWVPVSGDHIEVQDAGGRRRIAKPAWAANVLSRKFQSTIIRSGSGTMKARNATGNHSRRRAVGPHTSRIRPAMTPSRAKPLTKFTRARQAIRCTRTLPASICTTARGPGCFRARWARP